MSLNHVIAVYDLLDAPLVDGEAVRRFWLAQGAEESEIDVATVVGAGGTTDFVRLTIPGRQGRSHGGTAPTLGVLGRLGGIGARPEQIGFVSDGDGALCAVATGAKLLSMRARGDALDGDVVVSTHIDPDAPTQPHQPVPFMGSAVDQGTANAHEVVPGIDAILSIDTTKGNRLCNHRGFAITPTVRDGWILRVSDSLLDIYERTAGHAPVVLPITMQDITPYGNDVFHLNSIMQPSTATTAPVVGVAITTASVVAGSATGATDLTSIDMALRFVIETAKDFGRGLACFSEDEEFDRLVAHYGSMSALRGVAASGEGSS
jgi:hypothetical protein